jgi:hypothetical protein
MRLKSFNSTPFTWGRGAPGRGLFFWFEHGAGGDRRSDNVTQAFSRWHRQVANRSEFCARFSRLIESLSRLIGQGPRFFRFLPLRSEGEIVRLKYLPTSLAANCLRRVKSSHQAISKAFRTLCHQKIGNSKWDLTMFALDLLARILWSDAQLVFAVRARETKVLCHGSGSPNLALNCRLARIKPVLYLSLTQRSRRIPHQDEGLSPARQIHCGLDQDGEGSPLLPHWKCTSMD